MPIDPARQNELIQMAQMRLAQRDSDAPLSREDIGAVVDRLLTAFPEWRDQVSRDEALAQLGSIFSTFISEESILRGDGAHVPWLDGRRDSVRWRLWERYRTYLIRKRLPQPGINALNRVTDRTLELVGDPSLDLPFMRRGMVVGDVQSGKTGNYTGLICKAADAGYKVIIVLTGTNNNLRSQTQIRLDEGFIGKISTPVGEGSNLFVGVGEIDPSGIVNWCTNRKERGDFNYRVMSQFGIHPGGQPLLMVVKKNHSVLDGVIQWINGTGNVTDGANRRFSAMPMLMIDDEADNASVDTRRQQFIQGVADPRHQPTSINSKIRQILHRFDQQSYVAYTATPFANIFIHPDAETDLEQQDLFPRDFIINIPSPENYVGAARIFGLPADDPEDEPIEPGMPSLIINIVDHAASSSRRETRGWMPPLHRIDHLPRYEGEARVPPSLAEAVKCFALVVAARRARGQLAEHNSMLVHVTRFQAVQRRVIEQLQEELDELANEVRYGGPDGTRALQAVWRDRFQPVTARLALPDCPEVAWTDIEQALRTTIETIRIREINGTSADVLDYEANKATGLNVIAVGGDKLARGLTLEGLSVSYFLRGSTMYDSLLQMGRWFGYRPGYLDLCRLFSTQDHFDWYGHIAQANDELRRDFDRMEAVGATPAEFGLRVRSHPTLLVTSRAKMRHGTELQVSFAGDISETSVFSTDERTLTENFSAANDFIGRLPAAGHTSDPQQLRAGDSVHHWRGSHLWSGVPADQILAFLDRFSTHEDASRANAPILAKYIRRQIELGELTGWNVLLVSGDGRDSVTLGSHAVSSVVRQPKGGYGDGPPFRIIPADDRFVIRRLLNPRDEAVDISADAYDRAMARTLATPPKRRRRTDGPPTHPSGESLRHMRAPSTGLLLLYPLARTASIEHEGATVNHTFLPVATPPIGLGISFPASDRAQKVSYRVNSIYGDSDPDEGDA
ncbi:MAG: Z1 domain-containing protein [Rhizobiales bacterium]|nr:Z1 domain-containing protein [Hyphomicrobiales bacterium]